MHKIKLYLDTNTILDFFINQAMHIKGKGEVKVPEKAKFMLDNIERLELVVSFLVEAEVARELVSAHGLPDHAITKAWKEFVETYRCKYIEKFEFNRELVELVLITKMRLRTMFNFQHLFIAIKENAYTVSGDKNFVEKAREMNVYNKLISYTELRQMFSDVS